MTGPRRFPPDATSVRAAREFVGDALGGVADEQTEIILLATSELAANSVRHAGTDFAVTVERDEGSVRVTVEDTGSGQPTLQHPDPQTPSGRGLLIVDRLSDAWGTTEGNGRSRVWFSVRLEPSEASVR